jgi:hypothetical protein
MHVSHKPLRVESGNPRVYRTAALLFIVALLVQLGAMLAIHRLRGSVLSYAYQSRDAEEYVSLARGLAWHGRFSQSASPDHVQPIPDTWRTPGYPAVLALIIRFAGDSTPALILFQQVLSAATVPLLWLVMRRYASWRWALALSLLWCIDPFRIYYSLWLLAETLFTFALLLCILFYATRSRFSTGSGLTLGLLAGWVVLIRPIGLLIPLLGISGVFIWCLRARRAGAIPDSPWWKPAMACAVGTLLVVGPWCLRNKKVAGHFALSHQSGASLAYHKVMDVVLWSEGKSRLRFDYDTQDVARANIDARLRSEWQKRVGPLTPDQRFALVWDRLNYDVPIPMDPFVVSDLLSRIGIELLLENWKSTTACFWVQGLSMLVFPLGLVIDPPVGATPLTMLGGRGMLSKVAAGAIGGVYALLLLVVLWRIWSAVWERRWPVHFFVIWPALALFLFSLPSEDPRFRLPIVPLMLVLALPLGRGQWRGESQTDQ